MFENIIFVSSLKKYYMVLKRHWSWFYVWKTKEQIQNFWDYFVHVSLDIMLYKIEYYDIKYIINAIKN